MKNKMEYKTLPPKAKKLMRLTLALCLLIFIIIPTAVISIAIYINTDSILAICIFAAVFLISVTAFIIAPNIRYKRYKYLITEDRIEIVEGIFWVKRTIVPMDRIHQIDVARGPIDNAFKLSKVVVTTAGSAAAFKFIDIDVADEISEILNAKIASSLHEKEEIENV